MFKPAASLSLSELQALDPYKFERYVGDLFKANGYHVRNTVATGDEGVDLYVSKKDEIAVVQCKRFKGTVGPSVVRDLYGTMLHEHANKAYLVTTGRFTHKTQVWAKGKPIELIDGNQLARWTRSSLPQQHSIGSILPPISSIKMLLVSLGLCGGLLAISNLVSIFKSPYQSSTSVNAPSISTNVSQDSESPLKSTSSGNMTPVISTPEINSRLQSGLSKLDGVTSIEQLNTLESVTGGYTVFVKAHVENDRINVDLAKQMLSGVENTLGETVSQFVVFLDDESRTVNYIWTKTSPDHWTMTSRDK